jgi:carbonic anhydrase/acetyltransferase-like protein (isoleucine patch superfamily)
MNHKSRIGKDVCIGENCVLGNCIIADQVHIGRGVVIEDGAQIGFGARIQAGSIVGKDA